MNPQELNTKLDELNRKLEEVSVSVKTMKNYFKWTLIITVLAVVLPMIGLAFAIPSYLSQLNTITSF